METLTSIVHLHCDAPGAIQVLRNAVGSGRVSDFPEKTVTKMYVSTLLALRRGWVGVEFPEKSVT